jgi:hypothetical protein
MWYRISHIKLTATKTKPKMLINQKAAAEAMAGKGPIPW